MLTKKIPKIPKFYCEKCDTCTNNKKDYNKHLLTAKHKKIDSLTKMGISLTEKPQTIEYYACNYCEKLYKSRVGLWYHNKNSS